MFERIVLAVDSPDQARGAVAAAVDLATKSRGEVLIVHVHDTWLVSRQTVDLKTQDEARSLSAALLEAVLDVVTKEALRGRRGLRVAQAAGVAREIVHAATDFGADTIVLGSRGLGGFAGLPLGSVAYRVIQLADCPVVVARAAGAFAAARDRDERQTASVA
jgi:Universal stress protein UspA and related nucleotide-binding proteins